MQCATHPQIETHVSCQKCGKAICFRCMVETPVGYRCSTCAPRRVNALLTLSGEQLARAVAAGIGVAFLGGAGWGLIKRSEILFGLLAILAALGIGYLIGEAVRAAAGRKPARSLPWIAGACAALSFLIGNVLFWLLWTDVSVSTALRQWDNFDVRGSTWNILSMLLSVAMAAFRFR
jgi:hypothetical protein